MDIERVSSNGGSNDTSNALRSAHVPYFDVTVPTTRNNQIGVFAHELGAEDTVRMARETACSTFQCLSELACLLVVNPDLSILAGSQERLAVAFVVSSQQLISLIVDLV